MTAHDLSGTLDIYTKNNLVLILFPKEVNRGMAKKNDMGYFMCCGSQTGLVHVVAGVGLGFLLVSYFEATNVMVWGWILVALGVLGHFVWKMK